MAAPIVTTLKWGLIEIKGPDGKNLSYKDAKVWPGGSRKWDWGETGTRHVPGIQVADIQELIDKGAKKIVLSTGMDQVLRIHANTLKHLEENGVEVIVTHTKDAVERYNALAQAGELVGALFHSTC